MVRTTNLMNKNEQQEMNHKENEVSVLPLPNADQLVFEEIEPLY